MTRTSAALLLATALIALPHRALAQDEPKPIGPFVIDVRGTIPKFPSSNEGLAASRGLDPTELPGSGKGLDLDAQVYLLRWKAVTFGAGGQLTLGHSHADSQNVNGFITRPVTEHLTSIAPQISLNFGTGDGWSYLSGGMGISTWSIEIDGDAPLPADQEHLTTVNYGGGARWFIKPHVAFTFDVRFIQINPGKSALGFPGSPRTKMIILGAGFSLKK